MNGMDCPACGRPGFSPPAPCPGCGAVAVALPRAAPPPVPRVAAAAPAQPPVAPRADAWAAWHASRAPAGFDNSRFFPSPPPAAAKAPWSEAKVAAVWLLGGFFAVFVAQAPILYQIVLGAPIFEECLKAGLALLPLAAVRIRTLWARLPAAWLVGAGFGWLEHTVTYGEEGVHLLWLRIAFHAITAGLSMAFLGALRGAEGLDVRLGATLPASAVHYCNNVLAVALGLLGALLGFDPQPAGLVLALATTGAALLLTVSVAAWARPLAASLQKLARRAGVAPAAP